MLAPRRGLPAPKACVTRERGATEEPPGRPGRWAARASAVTAPPTRIDAGLRTRVQRRGAAYSHRNVTKEIASRANVLSLSRLAASRADNAERGTALG